MQTNIAIFQEFKRKLSPKTLRKQLSRAETQDSTGSLCASQDFDSSDRLSEGSVGTPTKTYKSKSSKVTQPIRSWLSGTSDSGKKSKTSGGSHGCPVQTPNGDTVKTQERNGSVHPMPNDASSSRILKSIEDNHHGDKSVYQAFKEKRSPKLKDVNKEAAAMKPQALKVVEFPDRILNEGQCHVEVSKSASEGHSPSSSSRQQQQQPQPRVTGESQSEAVPYFLSNHDNTPQAFTNNVVAMTTIQIDSVVMNPGQIEVMSRSLNDADTDEGDSKTSSAAGSPKVSSLPASLPESLDRKSLRLCQVDDPTLPPPLPAQQQQPLVAGTGSRQQRTKLEPPRTLNVREVSKLSKGVFTLPSTCMSAESIGPCSLDVSSIGTGKVTPDPPSRGRHWYLVETRLFSSFMS